MADCFDIPRNRHRRFKFVFGGRENEQPRRARYPDKEAESKIPDGLGTGHLVLAILIRKFPSLICYPTGLTVYPPASQHGVFSYGRVGGRARVGVEKMPTEMDPVGI